MTQGKTREQETAMESIRDLYRRVNNYASVTAVFSAANTQKEFTHTLGRPPIGWEVLRKDKAATIYSDSSVLGTQSVIRLKSDVASVTVTLRVK